MAELEIGYNINQAKKLMDDIKQEYSNLQSNITSEWEALVPVLQQEWIGEDEQSFEEKFAERICTLYENAHKLAKGSCETIADLVSSWHKFQATNVLDGNSTNSATIAIDIPEFTFQNPIVEKKAKTFSESEDRGLRSASSASTIQEAVTSYVDNVKQNTQNLFAEIKSNDAFFGDQVSSIDAFIAAVGEAIGEVLVAVKDLYTALEQLANTNYVESVSAVTETMNENKTSVENTTEELGESKWS